ncbi:MAG: hypothetical protein AAFS10_25430 [Myxococcota bacterium]
MGLARNVLYTAVYFTEGSPHHGVQILPAGALLLLGLGTAEKTAIQYV